MSSTHHVCPKRHCSRLVTNNRFACRDHWRELPIEVRTKFSDGSTPADARLSASLYWRSMEAGQ